MKLNGSWKTTLFGTGGLVTVLVNTASMLLDDNPATNPDWNLTITTLFLAISALMAKDYNVSNAHLPRPQAEKVEK